MTLPFYKKVINDGEITPHNFINANFVGFLSPSGEPIDYSAPFGYGGHDRNQTTDLFTKFFYKRYQKYDENGRVLYAVKEEEEKNEIETCQKNRQVILRELEHVNYMINYYKSRTLWLSKESDLMQKDLLEFFLNCYNCGSFNKGFGKNVRFMDELTFMDKFTFDYDKYDHYLATTLSELLKEVFVCYLGYHSVERIPRTITTSEFNIYETFYNYFLRDFKVVRLPKMIYNNDKKMYEEYKQSEFLVPEKELILKDEIESIKRMVPPNERHKYYR